MENATILTYKVGATLPDAFISCPDGSTGLDVDLTPYDTVALEVDDPFGNDMFRKVTGVVALDTGSVQIQWSSGGEIGDLTPGKYVCRIIATVGGLQRIWTGWLEIEGV